LLPIYQSTRRHIPEDLNLDGVLGCLTTLFQLHNIILILTQVKGGDDQERMIITDLNRWFIMLFNDALSTTELNEAGRRFHSKISE
jgi:hypothetical protein